MINSRQRAQLRALANGMETIFQVGKAGIGEQLIKQVDDALEARELIKLRTLEASDFTARRRNRRPCWCRCSPGNRHAFYSVPSKQ